MLKVFNDLKSKNVSTQDHTVAEHFSNFKEAILQCWSISVTSSCMFENWLSLHLSDDSDTAMFVNSKLVILRLLYKEFT